MISLKELKAKALAATQGSWKTFFSLNVKSDTGRLVATCGGHTSSVNSEAVECENKGNADFIAAANPQTILDMISELEAARAMRDEINSFNVGISLLGESKFSPLVDVYDAIRKKNEGGK